MEIEPDPLPNPDIHPSEPNYIWQEAGNNFVVLNDNDPYDPSGATNQNTNQHLAAFLTKAGKSWKSYQEDVDLTTVNGQLTNVPLPQDQWTVPLTSFSGVFGSGVNQYNGSSQFNYAAKHNPQVFFTDTNGGNDASTANPLSTHYASLQQLPTDLANNTVADYTRITPDQYHDMHTALSGGYKSLTGDPAKILQGDDFLSQVVPLIMASAAYQNNGVIVIWFDEAESDGVVGDNGDDFNHTIGEIIISPWLTGTSMACPMRARSTTRTPQTCAPGKRFSMSGRFCGNAENATDLSDLFQPGVIPAKP